MSESSEYTLRWRGRQSGPYTIERINRLLDDHQIGMGHEIQYEEQWISLQEFFARRKAAEPPARSAPPAARGAGHETKPPFKTTRPAAASPVETSAAPGSAAESPNPRPTQDAPATGRPRFRLVYALLAILLGFSGAHNYYARHWLTGLLQLLLSIATVLLGFGIIAPWLWALVEAVVVRRDGLGRDMR